ncbi:UNVERIFIED_CONTAM: Rac GTPase-activating protein 1 [Trichonephila clavipes]
MVLVLSEDIPESYHCFEGQEIGKSNIPCERRIVLIKEVLLADGNAIDNQTKERLFLLSNTTCRPQLDSQTKLTTIEESIGSLLSPSDIDDTDEDLNLNVSRRRKRRSKGNKRSSGDQIEKRKKFEGTIADYTSSTPPMIPSLIVHCVNEIESRGLKEIGLYRISGSERDVKDLKEKLLKGRSVISLNKVDIHAVCGTIKEFLRSLKEPLVTRAAWQTFVDAAEQKDETMSLNLLYEAVCELPQPNKETLAFLILHLQRVAEAHECRMPLENLAKVFGPTIVGYSSAEPADAHMLTETRQQCQCFT